jgi:hypothetical protein
MRDEGGDIVSVVTARYKLNMVESLNTDRQPSVFIALGETLCNEVQ